ARGYRGRAELTAEKFVPHPFSSTSGARLYRTGDRARFLPNGLLELFGRIEVGEIEALLSQPPGVREAVVQPREEMAGDKRLVAYLVADQEQQGSVESQQEQQQEYLETWHSLYEETYGQPAHQQESERPFSLIGWNSSYTGQPLSQEEMGEQIEQTVQRVLALRPERVLEIGCGTGLLLGRLAPFTKHYVGTDFSQAAITYLQSLPEVMALEQVQLRHQP